MCTTSARQTALVCSASILLLFTAPAAVAHAIPLIYDPLSPAAVVPGGPEFTLIVHGTGFVAGAVVNWNGSARPTTFISSSEVNAQIAAADVAKATSALVSVTNPAPGGGASNPLRLTVTSPLTALSMLSVPLTTRLNHITGAAIADLNRDGVQDIVALSSDNSFTVLPGKNNGSFATALPHNNVARLPYQVLVGDFNNDGIADLAILGGCCNWSPLNGILYIFLGKGDGTFHASQAVALGTVSGVPAYDGLQPGLYAFSIADLNGDGNLDVAVEKSDLSGSMVSIYLGNGNGTVQAARDFAAGPGSGNAGITVADFNGDGYLDIAVAAGAPGGLTANLLRGNGDGAFQSPASFPLAGTTYPYRSRPCIAADLNGDGRPDLVISVATPTGLAGAAVLVNDGAGSFQPAVTYFGSSFYSVQSLLVGDFNGDGKPDMAVGHSILPGAGDGTFGPAIKVGWYQPLASGDINADGKLDTFAEDSEAGGALWLSSPGAAITSVSNSFIPPAWVETGQASYGGAWLTNLGDGDLTLSPLTITGPAAHDFAMTADARACPSTGGTLTHGASCWLAVAFTPSAAGARTATLNLLGNQIGGPTTLPLSAIGDTAVMSVTPTSGTGLSQTFTMNVTDFVGGTYCTEKFGQTFCGSALASVVFVINTKPTWQDGCYIVFQYSYNPAVGQDWNRWAGYLLHDTPTGSSNGHCSVTSSLDVNSLASLPIAVQFSPSWVGTKNIYMHAADVFGAQSNWHLMGTWTPVADTPPTADSVSPSGQTGMTQTFTLTYSDTNGTADLAEARAMFNTNLGMANACVVRFSRSANSFYIMNDAGTALVGPLTPGSAGSLKNTQCTLNGVGSSVSFSGNSMIVNAAVTFDPGFLGPKTIYMLAQDNAGAQSGWQVRGAWTPRADTPPTADSVTPNGQSGATQTFTLTYSDVDGSADLFEGRVMFNKQWSMVGACDVRYIRSGNALYIMNDAGTAILGPLTPGSAGTLKNSQCTVNGAGSAVSYSANSMILSLSLTFDPGFTGLKNMYMLAVDKENGQSGWPLRGTWTP